MFIRLVGVCKLISFSRSLHSNYKELIKCVTLNNQPCKARIEAINSDESLFYPLTVSVNTYSGSCNAIDDLHAPFAYLN